MLAISPLLANLLFAMFKIFKKFVDIYSQLNCHKIGGKKKIREIDF